LPAASWSSVAIRSDVLVLGLPAGVWVDQLSYRRVIVGADLLAAAALTAVPILAVTGL
jgi:hypothetical protein